MENINSMENIIGNQVNSININLNKLTKKIFIFTELNSKQYENNINYVNYFKNINCFLNNIDYYYNLCHHNKEFYKNIIILIEKYITKKIFMKRVNIDYHINSDSLNLLDKYDNVQYLLNSLIKINKN